MFEHYKDLWGLAHTEFFTESLCGYIYKTEYNAQPAILKIYKDYGRVEESKGVELLKLCPSNMAVRVYKNDDKAVLLEYLPGSDLKDWVTQGRDDEATTAMAEICCQLHKIPIPDPAPDFYELDPWFDALWKAVDDTGHEYHTQLSKAAKIAKELLADKISPCLLHGDVHHQNVICDADGVPKMIDPKGLMGDPAYDVANMMRNPDIPNTVSQDRIHRQADIICEILNMDKDRILRYGLVHAWLSCCWSWMDGDRVVSESVKEAKLFDEIVT